MIKIKVEIDIPEEFERFFEYFKLNFNISREKYCTERVKEEIISRNDDLNLF